MISAMPAESRGRAGFAYSRKLDIGVDKSGQDREAEKNRVVFGPVNFHE
jgi:hypothetical protein